MVVKRVRRIISKIRPKGVKLVEIFREWQPVVESRIKGEAHRYAIMPRSKPERITINRLKTYVHYLEKSYPEEGFKLEARRVGLRKYWVVCKDGSKAKMPTVNLYFDLKRQRFYVEAAALENEKLAAYIVMRALGILGVSQSRYVSGRYVEGLGYLKPSQLKKVIGKNEPA